MTGKWTLREKERKRRKWETIKNLRNELAKKGETIRSLKSANIRLRRRIKFIIENKIYYLNDKGDILK